MLKKKLSLVTYTIIVCGLIMTVGIVCLLFIQNSIIKDDMELQAYEMLSQETRQVRRYIEYDKNSQPYIGDGYYERYVETENKDEKDPIFVVLMSLDGDYIAGNVSDKYIEKITYSANLEDHVIDGVEYYVLTRKGKIGLNKRIEDNFIICAMVSVKDIKSNYRVLWYRSFIVIGLVALFFILFATGLRRLIAVPVREMNVAINRSGRNLNFTEKLSPTFYY